ncbi:2-C-methyl-D-erythritol 4-phosphate cytidylyltransferase [Metabacillus schmidteae]|uniref:2-C-methyl-D-erythritol 4-phosphate cytidylyltransferase n=1 Tax=Metabacillus schmidteae TaxID=2730405 RepID=UPI001C3778B9|nr:2-C-methyl-D-erythritol 4-phosphate cytidylyltransferase [Metabacillus schmidteae]
MEKVHVIILASGKGRRLGNQIPKQFLKLAGKTIVEHTVEVFEKHPQIDEITIVVPQQYRYLLEEILLRNSFSKVKRVLNGGKSRKESSFIGLSALDDEDKVLIHDAVRPFVCNRIIDDCLSALNHYEAVDVAIPTSDTIIQIDHRHFIKDIPNRNKLKRGQTPQAFKVGLIKQAHILSMDDGFDNVTDDCGLVLKYQLADVFVVSGEEINIKITYKEDLYLADRLFQLSSNTEYGNINLLDIKNKVIAVFGGSNGIGREIVDLAKKYGAKVYSFSRNNGVDVTDYCKIKEVLNEIFLRESKIDYIVNTAGILNIGSIESRDIDDITYEINVNYLGAINVIKAGIQYLEMSNGAFLLFTSSSYTRGRSLYSTYSSTKAAIVNLVQGINEEFSINKNIRINAINPERTNTLMRIRNFGNEPEESLLDPFKVAEISLQTLLSKISGQVIDVRK